MTILIVTNQPKDWPAKIDNVDVVDARAYLTDARFSEARFVKVFNLCRSYRYQSTGYYVSLLAEARGHKPVPSVTTLQDIKSQAIVRIVSGELDELIQKSLGPIRSNKFELSVYFGRNLAHRYERLALNLFNQFQAPLIRAEFTRSKDRWSLRRVAPISTSDVPDSHWPFLIESAVHHFTRRSGGGRKRQHARFDMAILYNPDDPEPPSDAGALRKFISAAAHLGIAAELITKDDYGRLGEFDALFIRDTTYVNRYTYRFASRAENEGLVVIDDPRSIVRCTNKVYLAELLSRNRVPIPRTLVVHNDNKHTLKDVLGLPCVLKKPDSSFSKGVVKANDEQELETSLKEFLDESDLVVAQEYLPTTFDWRIGIIDREPLYACKYYMAKGHWQIIKQDEEGNGRYGKAETIPVELAPRAAVRAAVKAANLVGDGFYGVDIKESNGAFYVIEVNDNPSIDSKYEDAVLKDQLYRRVMQVFLTRIQHRKAGVGR